MALKPPKPSKQRRNQRKQEQHRAPLPSVRHSKAAQALLEKSSKVLLG